MIDTVLGALWYFWPAGHANVMPVYASKIPGLKELDQPLDFGKTFRGKRIFGSHKTWRGLIFAYIATLPVVWFQVYAYNHFEIIREISFVDYNTLNIFGWTFLMVIGALGGDAIRSFFKRQYNVTPGETWFPFDQIDYVIGGLITTSFVVQLSLVQYIAVLTIYFLLHPVATSLGYMFKIREKPI